MPDEKNNSQNQSSPNATNGSKPAENSEILEKCEKERGEYLNSWKRAKADLINYQKEEQKRFMEINALIQEGFIGDLLPVLESFELGIAAIEAKGAIDKGLHLVRSQLETVLKKRGLETIASDPGLVFDPHLHESVGEIESSAPPGTIVLEVAKGFMFNGKIIRAAKVKLSKAK